MSESRLLNLFAFLAALMVVEPLGSRPATKITSNLRNTHRVTLDPRANGSAFVAVNPFIANLQLLASDPAAVDTITFTIAPKPGSVTRPVGATFTRQYLQARGYFDVSTGVITLPVFGLYHDFTNTVNLRYEFNDGTSEQANTKITTGSFNDPCGYEDFATIQPRTASTDLSYDFLLVKGACSNYSPAIIDTDGALRWVGTGNIATLSSVFVNNGFDLASMHSSELLRIELDGTAREIANYSGAGVTAAGHHNIDRGKYGMLLEVNTTQWTECVVLEVNSCGDVLKSWNLADIISAAMTAGGDDPTQFVKPAPTDWFHNNAATYRASDDSIVVSSRENFVIAIDYDTGAIKWILGDPTKKWHTFSSLAAYALSLAPNTLPPIGQHAVSFDSNDNLLLFDDGAASGAVNTPVGAARTYSAPRLYKLDLANNLATEIWDYPNNQSLYSPFCSSIYEDAPLNYLIDYSFITMISGQPVMPQRTELLGLTAAGDKVFDYRYTKSNCNTGWNAIPIHLDNLLFSIPDPTKLQVSSLTLRAQKNTVNFFAVAGNTYRLQFKDALTDANWQTVADFAATCTGPAGIADTSATGETQRFYRVERVDPVSGRSG